VTDGIHLNAAFVPLLEAQMERLARLDPSWF
jgi:hypothetical protein